MPPSRRFSVLVLLSACVAAGAQTAFADSAIPVTLPYGFIWDAGDINGDGRADFIAESTYGPPLGPGVLVFARSA